MIIGDKWTFSDPLGRYALKTDWQQATVQVKATGYLPASATVQPGDNRHPVLDVELERDTAWLARPAIIADTRETPPAREPGDPRP